MEDSTKHLFFLTKITKTLAETFNQIHSLMCEEIKVIQQMKKGAVHQASQQQIIEEDNESSVVSESEQNKENEKKNSEIKSHKKSKNHDKVEKKPWSKKKKIARWKEEGKPRPPLNVFMLFLKASKAEIMQARPDLTPSQVSTYASNIWSELPEEEKEVYKRQYEETRKEYLKEMEAFKQKQEHKKQEAPKSVSQNVRREVVQVDSDEDSEQI